MAITVFSFPPDKGNVGTAAYLDVFGSIYEVLQGLKREGYDLRDVPGLKKKPSTSEVLDWLRLLLAEDLAPEDLRREGGPALPRLYGALLKNEQDVHLFERLAFMARSGR